MSTAQHTPGPWTLWHHKDSWAWYIDAGSVQMQITRTSDAGALQIDANARLIAESPEMLALLQQAIRHPMVTEGSEWWTKVRIVVAKATGSAA